MKKLCVVLTGLFALGLAMPATSLAGKGGEKKGGKHEDPFTRYDADANGTLDATEKEAVRKDFEKKPDGRLKKLDTDNDGKLSDEELNAFKPAGKGKKSKKNK